MKPLPAFACLLALAPTLVACTLPSKTVATFQQARNFDQYRYQQAYDACAPGYRVMAEMQRRHPDLNAMTEPQKQAALSGAYALDYRQTRDAIAKPCLLQTYTEAEINSYELSRREFLKVP